MLEVMVDKLIERKERINEALSGGKAPHQERTVSDSDFFRQAGIKVVKKEA